MTYRAALAFAALACALRAARAAPYAGSYIAYADAFSPCAEARGHMLFNLTLTPFNRRQPSTLQRMDGNVLFDYPDGLDDSSWVRVRLDQRSNHDWKLNAFIFNFPAMGCSTVRSQVPDFAMVTMGPDFINAKKCHIKSGNYFVPNQPINWTFPNFPVMPYGHWRFHLVLGKGKTVIGCTNVECHSMPKPSRH